MKKLLFIINPVAGRRMYRRFLADVLRTFSEGGYLVSVFMTEKTGDAAQCVRQIASEYDRVVCLGGDGTLNETVNGLISAGLEVPVGYIPAGSTNDFAASLGLSTDILNAAEDIMRGAERMVDAVRFGDVYFVNIADFGLFTGLSYNTPQNLKNILGGLAYVLGGIQDLSNLSTPTLRLRVGERIIEGEYAFGAICNATYMGGAFALPLGSEKPDDGAFEVLLVRRPETLQELQQVILSLVSGEYSSVCIEFFKTDSLTVEHFEGGAWSLDGERHDFGLPVDVSIMPCRLRFLTAPEA